MSDLTLTLDEEQALIHYGIIRRSGRYPWGSGGHYGEGGSETVVQRSRSFLDLVEYLSKRLGLSQTEVAEYVGMTTTQLRATKSIARHEIKAANIAYAQRLKDKGYSATAIGEKMGINESSVRELLAPGAKARNDQLHSVANILREQADKYGFVDVGVGNEAQLDITSTKLRTALAILESEGYAIDTVKITQVGTGEQTEIKVLAKPGTTQKEMWEASKADKIHVINVFSEDAGNTSIGIKPPLSVDPDRVMINWAELDKDGNPTLGGGQADGVIYVRPGVDDLSMGKSRYAQVRIAVGDGHYLKGMAVYKDDLPDGVDLMFNTNKTKMDNKLDALKEMQRLPDGSIDMEDPFGSAIRRQIIDIDPDTGKEFATSAMNIVNEEGSWDDWSNTLSSQFLAKQDIGLAEQQLGYLYDNKKAELDEIMSLTNPVVKEKLLQEFADSADAASVHLKAAAMPRQRNSVILPFESLKDNEIYSPNHNNGERVALVRHPHGGKFEIPELIVNNKSPVPKKVLGDAVDAVGINAKVAERLSGADFDGDTVLVIPNDKGQISSSPALKELTNFDPKIEYKLPDNVPAISDKYKQKQMGVVSNLITDMTIKGASNDELARAVRHSMVVIDAEKHRLDWKRSERDNGISDLKKKYQDGGASTLLSRAGSEVYVPKTKLRSAKDGGPIDPKTGKLVEVPWDTAPGKRAPTVKRERLALTDDAYTLSSGLAIEKTYANHSNRLKALANNARKEQLAVKPRPYDPEAKKTYRKQVDEIDAALRIAKLNAPRERRAQVLANALLTQRKQAHPNMDRDEEKKVRGQVLKEARVRTGASKTRINVTQSQWEAIQAGAISPTKLKEVLRHAEMDSVKKLAMPRSTSKLMSSSKLQRAKSMSNSGYTQAEIAQALGVSLTTLKEGLAGD